MPPSFCIGSGIAGEVVTGPIGSPPIGTYFCKPEVWRPGGAHIPEARRAGFVCFAGIEIVSVAVLRLFLVGIGDPPSQATARALLFLSSCRENATPGKKKCMQTHAFFSRPRPR